MMPILALAPRIAPGRAPSGAIGPTLVTLGVLIALLIVLGAGLVWFRRRVLTPRGRTDGAALIEDLRRMRDTGQITPEEFDAAKAAAVARLTGRRPPRAGPAGDASLRVAPPGRDLTGAPLPPPAPTPRPPPA